MSDIDTVWTVDHGDFVLAGADLQSGDDLTTAVLISLFTAAAAASDDVIPDAPPGQPGDPRGWWGDLGATAPIGSKLWLRVRGKVTPNLLTTIQADAKAALQWLIDDAVVAAIDVVAQYLAPRQLGLQVTLSRTNGTQSVLNFQSVWQGLS